MTCPLTSCPTSSLSIQTSSISNMPFTTTTMNKIQTSEFSIISNSTIQTIKRTYQEPCDRLYDCYIEYGLLCVYGWNKSKHCLCEGSHYWSHEKKICVRKGEINDSCEIDYHCHQEIGLICDRPFEISKKICVCAANLYWSKDSNCGQTSLQRIVDCTNENYATTCLILGMNNIYHMVTIRSITEKEISFDWFHIDNRILVQLPELSCAFNNDTKYCFGLSNENSEMALKLVQFTRKGFHTVENIGGINRGVAFGLTDLNSVAVFLRNSQNTLYFRMISNDEILSANNIGLLITGDPTCYIQDSGRERQIYCFARNSNFGLTEFAQLSIGNWRATLIGTINDRIRDEMAPVCAQVGQTFRYCFSIFENQQIYRILFNKTGWNSWKSIGQQNKYSFTIPPVLLVSNSLNKICYLIAIDDNNHYLQLSINFNCSYEDNFTDWSTMTTNMKFKQFNKTFELRDGTIGVLGINDKNHPYYIYLDRKTNRFSSPMLAMTKKPIKFRAH